MSKPPEDNLTLGAKVNRLFEAYRCRHQSEQTDHDVACSISHIIGKLVTADQLRALRRGADSAPDPDVIDGLTKHFAVPPEYLNTTGARARQLDTQLRLLVAARDAGVKRLALRGSSSDAEALLRAFDRLERAESDDA